MTLLAQQRQKSLDTWLAARGEAGRIMSEYGKRGDWQEWAEQEVMRSPYQSLLRRILSEQLALV